MKREITRIENQRVGFACERVVLENGLTVAVAPMPGYKGIHAVYGTDFGSVDLDFEQAGKTVHLPAGTAHFMEHKMFEKEEGDAFSLYAKTGASANAFTGFERTCYVFSATQNIDESLDILLSLVTTPYFTKETVEKEQGIIGQEIKMYDDSPDWRMMFALLRCLYFNSPVKEDIAGSVESISDITPELLYACAGAFYVPGNMVLSVAGNITMDRVLAAVERAGLAPAAPAAVKLSRPEPDEIVRPSDTFTMPIAQPALGVAFKERPWNEQARLRGEIICDLLCDLVCGPITPFFTRLYDEGLINGDFAGECGSGADYCAMMFTGETCDPERLHKELMDRIEELKRGGISDEDFTLARNLAYGEAVGDLENVETVATDLAAFTLRKATLFDRLEILATLTTDDVQQALSGMLRADHSARVIIEPAQ